MLFIRKGYTVIEVIDTDVNGDPVETIPITTLASSAATTTTDGQQGPIGSTSTVNTIGVGLLNSLLNWYLM